MGVQLHQPFSMDAIIQSCHIRIAEFILLYDLIVLLSNQMT